MTRAKKMLKIESQSQQAYREEGAQQQNFGNLNNIPDYALSTMTHLYSYLIKPFERSYGVVIYGEVKSEPGENWGRSVTLPSGEMLQIKFAPICCLQDFYDGITLISVKLTTLRGCNVKTAILFPPETNGPSAPTLMNRLSDPLGPRALHLLMVGFFRRHSSSDGDDQENTSNWLIDPAGYGSIRSTTFSITNCVPQGCATTCKKVRKTDFFSFDHTQSIAVTPGTSPFIIAGELINCKMPDAERRPSEPIHSKEYEKLSQKVIEGICSEDFETGTSAIAASISICEMLSGEGLISMLSNDFFKNTLPDRIKSPLGLGLTIAMAVRIAMVPGLHEMRAGTLCDQSACAELRTMFEGQIKAIPVLDNRWAIDIVISLALKQARSKCKKKDIGMDLQIRDQMVFWHRAGQSIVSTLFGLHSSFDMPLNTETGSPWRFHDPLISTRDRKLVELGANYNHVREPPRINFAPISKKRVTLIKMLLNVEKFLRSGISEGVRLMPENSSIKDAKLPACNPTTLNELFWPVVKKQINDGKSVNVMTEDEFHRRMMNSFNMASVNRAAEDLSDTLFAGPFSTYKHKIGAYLVSDSQRSPCADCQAPVHVLQGITMAFAFGECLNCHAKRCLECSSKYNIDDMIKKRNAAPYGSSVEFGAQCLSCGHIQSGLNVN